MENVGNYQHLKTIVVLPFPRFHLCEHTAIEGVSLKLGNHQLLSLGSNISFPSILRELDSGHPPSHALVCSSPSLLSAPGDTHLATHFQQAPSTGSPENNQVSPVTVEEGQTASVSYLYAVTRAHQVAGKWVEFFLAITKDHVWPRNLPPCAEQNSADTSVRVRRTWQPFQRLLVLWLKSSYSAPHSQTNWTLLLV